MPALAVCRAFQNTSSQIVWANEFDKYAEITYRLNFSHQLLPGDISEYENKLNYLLSCEAKLGERLKVPDILTSGFPCRAFLTAGRRLGFDVIGEFYQLLDNLDSGDDAVVVGVESLLELFRKALPLHNFELVLEQLFRKISCDFLGLRPQIRQGIGRLLAKP